MKLSVSLSEADVAELDRFVAEHELPSRSAGIQHAIDLLRAPKLVIEYAEAFAEWETSDDSRVWDQASADGLADAAW